MKKTGFTLVEVMVVLAILVIIASITLPAYQKHIIETRRSDAYIALSLAASEQERLYAITGHYTSDINMIGGSESPENFYTLSVHVVNGNYTLTANTAEDNMQIKDLPCLTITLDYLGVKLPNDCW